jgi:hypothetical protein
MPTVIDGASEKIAGARGSPTRHRPRGAHLIDARDDPGPGCGLFANWRWSLSLSLLVSGL